MRRKSMRRAESFTLGSVTVQKEAAVAGSMQKFAGDPAIRELRERTGRAFGVGVPLLVPGGREKAETALEERVPVINFSLGKGDWIVPRTHAYGGRVIATVTSVRHARAAASQGCDALLVVGNEGAGHGSACTSLVLSLIHI